MSPPVLSDLVRIRDCSSYNFRCQNILQVPQVRTIKYGKKSFRFAAAVLWNSFPDNFRHVSSFNQFKALLFQLCLFYFKLMLIHDGAVLAPAWIAGLNTTI